MRCTAIHCVGNRQGECALFELSGPGPCREFQMRQGAVCRHTDVAGNRYHGPYGIEVCRQCLATRKYCDTTRWRNGEAFGYVDYGQWQPYPDGWPTLEAMFGPVTLAEMLGQRVRSEHCPHV